jgi:hypothetical protein
MTIDNVEGGGGGGEKENEGENYFLINIYQRCLWEVF